MSKSGLSLFAGLIALAATACNNGVADTAQNAAICQRVCNQVGKCVGTSDTTNCREDCVQKSKDSEWEANAQDCSDCVDKDDSCVMKTLSCGSECAGVAVIAAQN